VCRWFNSALGHQISRGAKRRAKSAKQAIPPLATKHLAHFGVGLRGQVLVSAARFFYAEASAGALQYDAVRQPQAWGYAGATAARGVDGNGISLRDTEANRASNHFASTELLQQ